MTNTAATATYVTCSGCGRAFRGRRGLLAHKSARFQTAACTVPQPAADPNPEPRP